MPYFEFQGEGELYFEYDVLFSNCFGDQTIIYPSSWFSSRNILLVKNSSYLSKINLPGFQVFYPSSHLLPEGFDKCELIRGNFSNLSEILNYLDSTKQENRKKENPDRLTPELDCVGVVLMLMILVGSLVVLAVIECFKKINFNF
jgi:hypothetical protein